MYASIISFGFTPIVWGFTSLTTATLGMGGWLVLTQRGLAPLQKRQALLDTLTDELTRLRLLDYTCAAVPPGRVERGLAVKQIITKGSLFL